MGEFGLNGKEVARRWQGGWKGGWQGGWQGGGKPLRKTLVGMADYTVIR